MKEFVKFWKNKKSKICSDTARLVSKEDNLTKP